MGEIGGGGDIAGAVVVRRPSANGRAVEGVGAVGGGAEVGGPAFAEFAFGAVEVGGVGGDDIGISEVACQRRADALVAVVELEEGVHGGICEDRVLDLGRTGDAGRLGAQFEIAPGGIGRAMGGTTVKGGLGGGEADVAGDPASVGAGGDVEVAVGVDRAATGTGEGAVGADVGEAGGAGGIAGVGATGASWVAPPLGEETSS